MRTKTRGGRDQDQWRKIEARIRLRKWMKPHLFINGVEVEYETLRMEDYCRANGIEFRRFVPDRCEWLDGTLTLKDNPDCDFVKGGER